MPSIFPELNAGGLEIRDVAGNPLNPPAVERAYKPLPAFLSSCIFTALPSDCTARIEPRQLNAIVSELTSFAECLDPNGPWDCNSLQNLCAAFREWVLLNVTRVYISDTPPVAPVHRDLWWESDTGILYIYYDDGNTKQWVQTDPPVPGKEVYIGDAPPPNPQPETLWWESDSGNLFIYYNDGNSSQWVQAMNTSVVVDRVSIIGAGSTIDPFSVALVDCGIW